MPRGAKIDKQATKEKAYKDPRSFISTYGDEYLKGEDLHERRKEVYARSHGRCFLNLSPRCRGWIRYNDFELHHKHGGHVGRNDNLDNLSAVCGPCHRAAHVSPRFNRKRQEAIRDFQVTNQEEQP